MKSKSKSKRIAVIGLGLIGGSLAKALSKKGYEVTGISKSEKTIKNALKGKAIKKGFLNITSNSLNDVEIIFICTPLSLVKDKIKEISKVAKNKLILTDVGSTKSDICNYAKKVLPKNITFVGGHPMAGNEFSGFNYADEKLFKNCTWVLIKENKNIEALKPLEKVIKEVEAKVVISDSHAHDKAVAIISHLPILVSSALCKLLMDLKDEKIKKLGLILAASGFRDTTRVASGNPKLSSDLLSINQKEIKKLLPLYLNYLKIINFSEPKFLKELEKISLFRQKMYLSS